LLPEPAADRGRRRRRDHQHLRHAVVVDGSDATSFIDVKLFASPDFGILENGGPGSMLLQQVSVVPGPRPKGANTDRLVSTNADGSHFIAVERGPVIEDCSFANTGDDAVNVHGFYYYVVEKVAPRRYLLTPKWDIGLAAGDEIETCDHATFASLGRTRIAQLSKRQAPELKAKIAAIWKNNSPTTQSNLIYDAVLEQDLPLKAADSITWLTRIGAGTTVRRSSFHACGHVVVKAPNTIVEDCQFAYSSTIALQAGSSIGYWSEFGFAENLIFRNNRFTLAMTGANALTGRQWRAWRHLCRHIQSRRCKRLPRQFSEPQRHHRRQPHRRFLRLRDLRRQRRQRADHRQRDRPDLYSRQCL
jgi:hypothetical protein